jgi:dienelactone hydrolase
MSRAFLRIQRGLLLIASLWMLAGCSSGALLRLASSADLMNSSVRVEHDIAYGALPRQRMDLYVPTVSSEKPRPVVVFIHGGSWNWGSKDQYRFVGAALAERGAVVAIVNYRLSPQAHLQDSLEDIVAAVSRVQSEVPRRGGDAGRVYLMGHSAGAELAALIALDPARLQSVAARPVRGFVGLAGPYDFLPLTDEYLKEYFGPPELYPASQPVNVVTSGSAPSLLVQGLKDTTVWPRNVEALAVRLRSVGVPVETLMLDEDDHSTILKRLARPYRRDDVVLGKVVEFIGTSQ